MVRLLDSALGAARRLAHAGALAGGLLILAAALLVSVDVTLRKLANTTLGGADELSGYALAIGSTWSFAFVLLARGHVRIDALVQHLPRRLAAACDLLALAGLLAFASLIAWHGAGVLAQSWSLGARSNSSLAVPLALPQALWWIGYAGFVVCAALLLLRAAASMLAGDLSAANRLIGARSVQEEAADELANAMAARKAGATP
ncbi:MAG: TRAP transporter small permease subunit [Burkholderiaceae bacterium]|nr:TRAP transporter small permease subunit [Burkholderiaceae bacterium]